MHPVRGKEGTGVVCRGDQRAGDGVGKELFLSHTTNDFYFSILHFYLFLSKFPTYSEGKQFPLPLRLVSELTMEIRGTAGPVPNTR